MPDELRLPESSNPAPAAQQMPPQFPTDAESISTVYTNFCRVKMTVEELILDFGLNTEMMPNPAEPIKLSHRVVMNFYTAKRLLDTLIKVIRQHESNFGVLEVDFQKRARGPLFNPPPTGPKG